MMRKALTIAKKEVSISFTTPIGYGAFGVYTFILGLLFVTSVNRFQEYTQLYLAQQKPEMLEQLNFHDAIVGPMLSTGVWLFLFFIPFLTMRMFAEEKSSRTFELLMTAPITSFDMVVGKFLGAMPLVVLMAATPAIFPLILHVYGVGTTGGSSVEWSPVWSGCISILLLGATFTSIGLLVSAASESQIVAALLTFAALLLLSLLPTVGARLEGDWRAVVSYVGPVLHVARGIHGRLSLADLVYFGTSTAFFLFLTLRVVESHRWRG